jgi:hypothetical protein
VCGQRRTVLRRLCGLIQARCRSEAGFALAEAIIAVTLFLGIALSLEAVLTSGVVGHSGAQHRTLAEQLATDQLETIRRLDYDQVGTVTGNPPGTVVARRNVAVDGASLTLVTRIRYVDDPVPGDYQTQANYKSVRVIVTETASGKRLAQHETLVAPPTQPLRNKGIIRVQVVDFALASGVPDATVDLQTGPSAPRSDVTEPDGTVTFPDLVPNPTPSSYYDLQVTAAGYLTLREDVSPGAAAHVRVAPGQVIATSIRVYKPATIELVLTDNLGAPYTGPATVTLSSSRGSQDFAVTGGRLTVTQIGGEYVVPGLQYTASARTSTGLFSASVTQTVPRSYPTDLGSTFTLVLQPYSFAKLNVQVRDRVNRGPIPGALVEVSGGPGSIYMSGVANSGGIISFDVPAGSAPYSVTAREPAGPKWGTAVDTVPGPGAKNVTVDVGV